MFFNLCIKNQSQYVNYTFTTHCSCHGFLKKKTLDAVNFVEHGDYNEMGFQLAKYSESLRSNPNEMLIILPPVVIFISTAQF